MVPLDMSWGNRHPVVAIRFFPDTVASQLILSVTPRRRSLVVYCHALRDSRYASLSIRSFEPGGSRDQKRFPEYSEGRRLRRATGTTKQRQDRETSWTLRGHFGFGDDDARAQKQTYSF